MDEKSAGRRVWTFREVVKNVAEHKNCIYVFMALNGPGGQEPGSTTSDQPELF